MYILDVILDRSAPYFQAIRSYITAEVQEQVHRQNNDICDRLSTLIKVIDSSLATLRRRVDQLETTLMRTVDLQTRMESQLTVMEHVVSDHTPMANLTTLVRDLGEELKDIRRSIVEERALSAERFRTIEARNEKKKHHW